MYVSESADWAKQKNSKEKGHCFILMSNAPFYGLIRLSYGAGPSSVFLNKWILLFGKGLFLVILCLRFYIRFLIKVPPLNLRQDGRVMGLLLFTVFLRAS